MVSKTPFTSRYTQKPFQISNDATNTGGTEYCKLFLFLLFNSRNQPKLSFTDWVKYLDEISKTKSVGAEEIKGKLAECGKPGLSAGTTVVH